MSVDEGRSKSLTAVAGGALEGGITGHRIGAVDLFEMEVGESGDQARDAAACCLDFNGNRNRVPVVFDAEDDRKLAERGSVHRLPELAFARGTVTQRNV